MVISEYRVIRVHRVTIAPGHDHIVDVQVEVGPQGFRPQLMHATEVDMRRDAGESFFTVGPISGRRAEVAVYRCEGCGVLTFESVGGGHTDENVEYFEDIADA